MESQTIIVSKDAPGVVYANATLTYTVPGQFKTDNQLVGLKMANLYKSWRNVTTAYNNNSFSYNFNGSVYPVLMPDGNYTYANLSDFFNQKQIANGHYLLDSNGNQVTFISLTLNPVYYALTLVCTPIPTALTGAYAGYTNPAGITLSGNCPLLIVPSTAIVTYLGYAAGTYPSVTQGTPYSTNSTAPPQVDIVTNIFVGCDLADSTGVCYQQDIIAQLSPTTTNYGAQLVYMPANVSYYRTVNKAVTKIVVRFLDQTGTPLNIYDPGSISVTLDLISNSRH